MVYHIFEHEITIDSEALTSYGVVAKENNLVLRCIYDVARDKHALELLIEKLNRGNVDLVLLDGIIEDFYLTDC